MLPMSRSEVRMSNAPGFSFFTLHLSFLRFDIAKMVQTSAEPSLLELCRVQPIFERSAKV